jgi:hypothetical protein
MDQMAHTEKMLL